MFLNDGPKGSLMMELKMFHSDDTKKFKKVH